MLISDIIKDYWLIFKWQRESKSFALPPEKWKVGKRGNVLLINGWRESWYFLKKVGDYLNNKGYKILVPLELKKNILSVDEGTQLVQNFVGDQECFIVAHSKGGLLGLNLINHSKQFKKLIAICAPFKGTIWAHVLPDKTLEDLKIKHTRHNRVGEKVVCLYPEFDAHVIPLKHSLLEAANNIKIDVVGHTRILNDERTWKTIVKELET